VLLAREVCVNVDSKGRALDNVFGERLSRSLKYEEVYPPACANVHHAWTGISRWLHFYNHQRPHHALGYGLPHSYTGVPYGVAGADSLNPQPSTVCQFHPFDSTTATYQHTFTVGADANSGTPEVV
jgi:hypothetical protein